MDCPNCGIDLGGWGAVRDYRISDARMEDDGTMVVAERMVQSYATCANCEGMLPEPAVIDTDPDFFTDDYEAYFAGIAAGV